MMDDAIEFTQVIVDKTIENLKKEKSFKKLVSKLEEFNGFYPKIAYLTNYIVCTLCWFGENKNQKILESYVLASLIMDSSLNDEDLAMFEDFEEVNTISKLSLEKQDNFFSHPERSAQILDNFQGNKTFCEELIRRHHERPCGKGFPNGLDEFEIKPRVGLFIMGHHLAYQILKNGSFDHKFKKELKVKYSKGGFEVAYQAFLKSFNFKD